LINFVDATNDANHYTKPPPGRTISSLPGGFADKPVGQQITLLTTSSPTISQQHRQVQSTGELSA